MKLPLYFTSMLLPHKGPILASWEGRVILMGLWINFLLDYTRGKVNISPGWERWSLLNQFALSSLISSCIVSLFPNILVLMWIGIFFGILLMVPKNYTLWGGTKFLYLHLWRGGAWYIKNL